MRLSRLLGLFFLLITTFSFTQSSQETLEFYKEKYKGQHVVNTKFNHTIRISLDNGEPRVVHSFEYEYIVIDKNGLLALNEETLEFSPFEKIDKIEAYSLVPHKTGYKKIKADNFATRDAEADRGTFYDGNMKTTFRYPGLVIGAIRYLYYELEMEEARFPFGHSFYSSYPQEQSQLTIEMDSAIHLLTRSYHGEGVNIQIKESVIKNKRIINCNSDSVATIKREDYAAPFRYYYPHILAQISHYYYKGERINITSNLDDLHRSYRGNINNVINEIPSDDIRKISDSITAGITDDFGKVKAIYYWVQDNLKYVAFEKGVEGYIPRQPNDVVKKRFGDCKDMASLIYSMLKSIGVESYISWIGSRDLPYRYTDFPSSYCDNHMITIYKKGNNSYFLDATNSLQNIDEPTSFIQGKEVLVSLGEDLYEVLEVPIVKSTHNRMMDTTYIEVEGKLLKGNSTMRLSGYYRNDIADYYVSGHGETDEKFIESINEKGNNNFKVTEGKVHYTKDRETELVMNYSWEANNYVTSLDDEIYINLHLDKSDGIGEMKIGRKAPLEMMFERFDSFNVILEIPEGYEAIKIPNNEKFNSNEINCSINYAQIGNQITMSMDLELKFIILQPDKFKIWNDFVQMRKKVYSESVVLKKVEL